MFKRVLAVGGGLGLLTVFLASSAAAGGGCGFGGPGRCTLTDSNASANLSDSTGDFVGIYVDHGYQSFKQSRTPGAPVIEQFGTVLSVYESLADGTFANGCWVIPDSSFAVGSDLSTATLNVSATPDMQCQGYYIGAAAGGKPGRQTSLGFGGGGGGYTLTSVVANVSWTGNGAKWTDLSSGSAHCQSYASSTQGSFESEYGSASGVVDALNGLLDPLAQVATQHYSVQSNSTPSGLCNPFGF
jgi:hypothetical protein